MTKTSTAFIKMLDGSIAVLSIGGALDDAEQKMMDWLYLLRVAWCPGCSGYVELESGDFEHCPHCHSLVWESEDSYD